MSKENGDRTPPDGDSGGDNGVVAAKPGDAQDPKPDAAQDSKLGDAPAPKSGAVQDSKSSDAPTPKSSDAPVPTEDAPAPTIAESGSTGFVLANRLQLPVLPLRGMVVFPAVGAQITVGRAKTMRAIEEAISGSKQLFAVAQLDARVELPEPSELHRIGTICQITEMRKMRGGVQVFLEGDTRADVIEYAERDGYLEAVARPMEEMDPIDPNDRSFTALYKELVERATQVCYLRGLTKGTVDQLLGASTPGELADRIASYAELDVGQKQDLLETLSVETRLRTLLVHLQKQFVLLKAQEEIREQVQEELGERQREIFLREQMKTIQKELGEDTDSQETNDLRERIAALELPPEARREVDRELRRLERIPREAAESQVVRTYLELVADLPWSEVTEEQLDISRAEDVLERDHYGLRDVKERVLDFLAVRKLQEDAAATQAAEALAREAAEAEAQEAAEAGAEEAGQTGGEARAEEAGETGAEEAGQTAGQDTAEAETVSADDADGGEAGGEVLGEAGEVGISNAGGAEAEASGARETSAGEEREASAGEEAAPESDPYEDDRTGETLLFVGPPGVGKTSIARSIADAMGRKYVRVSLGGARDEADIRGHRRTYVGAMAGRIIEGLKRAGTKNPVFLLDEIDKLGISFQGDPSAALMEVLDPAQNGAFVDHYLGVPFDLSEVLFIATANIYQQIPGPLRDRMEVIDFRGYTLAEKLEIAKRFLLPRQKRRSGLLPDHLEVDDDAIRTIVTSYTHEAGVRNLERELGSVCRKSARKIAGGQSEVAVDAGGLRDLLGQPKVHPAKKMNEDTTGVATGMYYTPVGGDIMLVETIVLKGKEGLVMTGQLGDVMKESAQAALTFARSRANQLKLSDERLRDHEIHIHVPAGAVPKEGPSAGIAMAAALVSALGNHPVRHDIAMTGEITLSGRVLPIGGVKEKVLGAYRAGIREIILPADNEGDLEDLPGEVCRQLDFHFAGTLDEAFAAALADVSLEGGSLSFADKPA